MRLTINPALHYDADQMNDYAEVLNQLTEYYGDGANVVLAALIQADYITETEVSCPNLEYTYLCPGCKTLTDAVEFLVNDGLLEMDEDDTIETMAQDISRNFTAVSVEDNYVIFDN